MAKPSVFPLPSRNVGASELRVTVPLSVETVVGRPDTVGVTVCDLVPSLVTLTLNVAFLPASTIAFRLVLLTRSVLPRRLDAPIDKASRAALSALTSPAPWWPTGAPRSVAVLTMTRLTSAGDGSAPWWFSAYASITSAAVPAVSAADALVPPAAMRGCGEAPRSGSAQPRNTVVSGLHSAQPASPGATTSTVCGLNSVMPPELSAEMLLFSQPDPNCVPELLVCTYTW